MKDEKILTIKDKDLGDVAGGSGGFICLLGQSSDLLLGGLDHVHI